MMENSGGGDEKDNPMAVSKEAGCGSLWGELETGKEQAWRLSYLSKGAYLHA